jgi:hypothetical protein
MVGMILECQQFQDLRREGIPIIRKFCDIIGVAKEKI